MFGFGPGGRPAVIALRDVEAHCPACGYEAIERRYEAHPFHSLTVGALTRALDTTPLPFDATCAQCDASVGDEDVRRWVLHYGFPAGRGLIQGFADVAGERRWLLSPDLAFDVQLIPEWDAIGAGTRVEVATLDERAVRRAFGRPLNGKAVARQAARGGAGVTYLTPNLALITSESPGDDAARDALSKGAWHVEAIVCAGEPAAGPAGCAAEWWPTDASVRWAWGAARVPAPDDYARVLPAEFPTDARFVEDAPGDVRMTGAEPEPRFDSVGIAAEAARTLIDRDDAIRLELDRALLALTGVWDGAPE